MKGRIWVVGIVVIIYFASLVLALDAGSSASATTDPSQPARFTGGEDIDSVWKAIRGKLTTRTAVPAGCYDPGRNNWEDCDILHQKPVPRSATPVKGSASDEAIGVAIDNLAGVPDVIKDQLKEAAKGGRQMFKEALESVKEYLPAGKTIADLLDIFDLQDRSAQPIADVALREWIRWDQGKLQEGSSAGVEIIKKDYWPVVSSETYNGQAWSAAFISYVMKSAGIENFPSKSAHINYIKTIADDHTSCSLSWTEDAENLDKLAAGDLLCYVREQGREIRKGFDFKKEVGSDGWPTHCDVVVNVNDVVPKTYDVIGGNVAQSVSKRQVTTEKIKTASGSSDSYEQYFGFIHCNPPTVIPIAGASPSGSKLSDIYSRYQKQIDEASDEHGVPKDVLVAIIKQESNGKPKEVSPGAAAGLMQFVPMTFIEQGGDVAFIGINIDSDDVRDSGDIATEYKKIMDGRWSDCRKTWVSPCNWCDRSQCDYTNDERFNPDISIDLGAKYLKKLFNAQTGDDNTKWTNAFKRYHGATGKTDEERKAAEEANAAYAESVNKYRKEFTSTAYA